MKKLLFLATFLLVAVSSYANWDGEDRWGVEGWGVDRWDTGGGGSGSDYWDTAMTDRWSTAMSALWNTTMDTEIP